MTETPALIPTVLNVDDFEPGRYARSRILRQAGYSVQEAATGGAALDMVRRLHPRVVILDINLPDMSGFEVCRIIKTDPEMASTLVLQISAQSVASADWAKALETGADAYLTDPVDPAVLLGTVRALFRIAKTEHELQQANLELRRSNDDLARFAYVASHDLQEPLRTITAYSQLLVRRYRGQLGEEADRFIDFVVGGAARMNQLIHDLLLFSQAGVKREFSLVDLNRVLEDVLVAVHVSIQETGAEVTHDDLPTLSGDEEQIAQLLQNLISNSMKYRSAEPPRIHIAAERRGEKWLLSVRDNGIGFASKYSEHIFEAFKRLDQKGSSGTGIGLAIAKRVVENHGGEIWADSEPGRGATFYFTLREEPERQARSQPAHG